MAASATGWSNIVLVIFLIIGMPLYGLQTGGNITVYVVSHGWHTGIVFPFQALPDSLQNRFALLDTPVYMEVGWGDHDFYQSAGDDYWLAAKAALLPTKSVLHVVGFDQTVERYFSHSDLRKLSLPQKSWNQLMQFIHDSFLLDEDRQYQPLGKGLYGHSYFYIGKEYYIFPRTCNVWTARALEHAGMDINPYLYQRAGRLMNRLKDTDIHFGD